MLTQALRCFTSGRRNRTAVAVHSTPPVEKGSAFTLTTRLHDLNNG
jgi:hypothetical protein